MEDYSIRTAAVCGVISACGILSTVFGDSGLIVLTVSCYLASAYFAICAAGGDLDKTSNQIALLGLIIGILSSIYLTLYLFIIVIWLRKVANEVCNHKDSAFRWGVYKIDPKLKKCVTKPKMGGRNNL